jgi:hypothetical protein
MQFQGSWSKKVLRPHLNGKLLGEVVHPSYDEKYKTGGSQITVQAGLGKK